jgi:hypothetical protein
MSSRTAEQDQAFDQLKSKLERAAGEAERGELLDGEEAFEELREMIANRSRTPSR